MKIKKLVFAMGLTVLAASANAGVKDLADEFWQETQTSSANINATGGGSYSSATQHNFYGPSFRMRVPNRKIKLFHVTPPKISAGCNGIDLYMGSFSFIDGDQLKQLIRATMEGIPAYAFSIAMKHMCPTCESTMQDLANKVNEMSKFSKDSCALTKKIVDDSNFEEYIKEKAVKIKSGFGEETSSSTSPDYLATLRDTQEPEQSVSEELLETNFVWDSLKKNETATWFASVSDSGSLFDYELLMSLVGTVVAEIDNSTKEINVRELPAILPKDVLVNGSSGRLVSYIDCGVGTSSVNDSCIDASIKSEVVEIPSLTKTIGLIIEEMENKINLRGPGSELSASAKDFIAIDPLMTASFINALKENGAYRAYNLKEKNAELIARFIVNEMLLNIYGSIKASISNTDNVNQKTKERVLDNIDKEIMKVHQDLNDSKNDITKVRMEYLKVIDIQKRLTKAK